MANSMFIFEQFGIGTGVEDMKYTSSKGFDGGEGGNYKGKQAHFFEAGNWRESSTIDSLCSDFGFSQENATDGGFSLSKYQQQDRVVHEQQNQPISDYGLFDDFHFDVISPRIQPCVEEIARLGDISNGMPDLVEPKREKQQYPFSLASLEVLNNYGSGFKRLNCEKINEPSYDTTCTGVGGGGSGRGLSTEEIVRVAGARFIQSYSPVIGDLSMLSHTFGFYFSGLSNAEINDVQLAELLLASAEKVGYQQFERAVRLLNQCDYLSSNTGNPIQRVIYYFSEALREKIDRETGRITSKGLGKRQSYDLEEAIMCTNAFTLACHQGIPFPQVAQFTGIQAIVENVGKAKRVHVIDFIIGHGARWTVLMQALAARDECPLERLKITAVVGTASKSKVEDTGKRLLSFAQSMNLPFSFKVVAVSDMLELKEDHFELEPDEAVAVYFSAILRTMIARPNRLESLMRVIRNINPCIMLLLEVEASHNSTSFVNRFIDALFFYSAYFDCIEACMDHDDPNRMVMESIFLSQSIRNIVATEGKERTTRHVKMDVWRAFFARFGMKEAKLSMSSLYQASLVVKNFACGSSCTLDMDGNCLILGWKGTPIHSLSAWKFR